MQANGVIKILSCVATLLGNDANYSLIILCVSLEFLVT